MNSHTVSVILITLVLIGGGYWYFSSRSDTDTPLSIETVDAGMEAQSEFQMLVSQLGSISFSTDIFGDPRFTALVDLTTPTEPEASGRLDPFAPLGVTPGP